MGMAGLSSRPPAIHVVTCTVLCGALALGSCGGTEPEPGLPLLGDGSHDLSQVSFTVISDTDDGLNVPTDLAFDPDDGSTLWVMNQAPREAPPWTEDEPPPRNAPALEHWPSVTVYFGLDFDLEDDGHTSRHIIDPWGIHHMANVTSIAFGAHHVPHRDAPSDPGGPGDPRSFATCHESRNQFKGYRDPNDFMGPNLWSGQLGPQPDPEYDFFGESFPAAVEAAQEGCLSGCDEGDTACEEACLLRDPGSHLDMLHESPNCMGLAWEVDNVYWVLDGCGGHQVVDGEIGDCEAKGDIVRYDFMEDHGPGRHDHTMGTIDRYAEGVVESVEGVPSHMQIDHATRELFIVDSGGNRILVADIDAGERGESLPSRDGTGAHHAWVGAEITTLVDGSAAGMQVPSGLALYGEYILVTDNALSRVFAFDRNGALVDYLDLELGAGALMGIAVAEDGSIVGVDAVRSRVWRLAASTTG